MYLRKKLCNVIYAQYLFYKNSGQVRRTGLRRHKENSIKETSDISFKGLTSGVKKLPPLPTEDEWNNILDNKGVFRQRLEEDFSKHGDIVKRFYASEDYEYYYIDVVIADLTADGVPEQILSFDGGGTYGIIKYEIISGEEIIVTIEPQSVGRSGAFQPHDTGNGFSVIWYTEDMFPNGYCCPVEQITTTFKYEDMKFIAIEEKSESATY
jgi:hypothetical protein